MADSNTGKSVQIDGTASGRDGADVERRDAQKAHPGPKRAGQVTINRVSSDGRGRDGTVRRRKAGSTRMKTDPKQRITVIAWIAGQLVIFGGVLAGLIYWTASGGDERVNVVLGLVVVAVWLVFVLWGLTQIALSARKEQRDRDYLTGLVVGCALGVGIMLIVYRLIEGDVVGIGFELVLISSFVIWFAGSQARRRRK
jgi:ABC-type Mn2+/Zn2+ transport system permease subunit